MKVHFQDVNAPVLLKKAIIDLIKAIIDLIKAKNETVFVCVGTDASTGDSLAPLIGSALQQENSRRPFKNVKVYGTLHDPIHGKNINEKSEEISANHPNAFCIAIDSCLGLTKNIGLISVTETPLKPGSGVNKDLPPIGDASILGTVNIGGFLEHFVLQSTRLSFVMDMANVISSAIIEAIREVEKQDWQIQRKYS